MFRLKLCRVINDGSLPAGLYNGRRDYDRIRKKGITNLGKEYIPLNAGLLSWYTMVRT